MAGYHLNKIPKGELGKWSKITEEWAEFEDAKQQGSKIMMAVELADLYGAVREFYQQYGFNGDALLACQQEMDKVKDEAHELGLTIDDLKVFSDITARAFRSGERG
jgi:hypothetical protein